MSWFRRWRAYMAWRFPPGAFVPPLLALSFSGVCLSRLLRGSREWPSFFPTLAAFVCVFLFFLQLRFIDEFKDAGAAAPRRPGPPVPLGLPSLRQIGRALAVAAVVQVIFAAVLSPRALLPLAAVWACMALAAKEFLVASRIKLRLRARVWSRMLAAPLIYFFAASCDWLPRQAAPPPGLVLFLAVGFFNGLLVELGRGIRPPVPKRPGAGASGSRGGPRKALRAHRVVLLLSFHGTMLAGSRLDFFLPTVLVMSVLLMLVLRVGSDFLDDPRAGSGKKLETYSGLFVMASYLFMGVIPLGVAQWTR